MLMELLAHLCINDNRSCLCNAAQRSIYLAGKLKEDEHMRARYFSKSSTCSLHCFRALK